MPWNECKPRTGHGAVINSPTSMKVGFNSHRRISAFHNERFFSLLFLPSSSATGMALSNGTFMKQAELAEAD